jgi:prevent-host-death family protein
MNTSTVDKKIPAFTARRQFGQLLHGVEVKGDRYVVERHGEPVAALVPMAVYEQWQRSRAAFFAKMRKAAEHADLSEDEASALADAAIANVRRHRS